MRESNSLSVCDFVLRGTIGIFVSRSHIVENAMDVNLFQFPNVIAVAQELKSV